MKKKINLYLFFKKILKKFSLSTFKKINLKNIFKFEHIFRVKNLDLNTIIFILILLISIFNVNEIINTYHDNTQIMNNTNDSNIIRILFYILKLILIINNMFFNIIGDNFWDNVEIFIYSFTF